MGNHNKLRVMHLRIESALMEGREVIRQYADYEIMSAPEMKQAEQMLSENVRRTQ